MPLQLINPEPPFDPRARSMLPAVGGFPPSDRNLFLAGYGELCREDLSGKRVLEICGGFGKLAAGLAEQFPMAEVIGLDILLVAAIRAVRMARHELGDESNLYLSQFERMSKYFSACEVQMFNLLGYPMKSFSDRLGLFFEAVQKLDSWLFRSFNGLLRYGANCNLIFTK